MVGTGYAAGDGLVHADERRTTNDAVDSTASLADTSRVDDQAGFLGDFDDAPDAVDTTAVVRAANNSGRLVQRVLSDHGRLVISAKCCTRAIPR